MKILFLGTGPTTRVEGKGKNLRRNSSALLTFRKTNILIDCSRDFAEQAEVFGIKKIDLILQTHAHNDCSYGLGSQLREWMKQRNIKKIPVLLERQSWKRIQEDFKNLEHLEPVFFKPYQRININGLRVVPFRVEHSIQPGFPTVGFLFENKKFAYSEDVGSIPEESVKYVKNLNYWVLDGAMWFGRQIKGHLTVSETIRIAEENRTKTLIIIQAGHTYPKYSEAVEKIRQFHQEIYPNSKMKIILAYDGLVLTI